MADVNSISSISGTGAAQAAYPIMKDAAEKSDPAKQSPNDILKQHEKLLAHVARSFATPGIEVDDLIQIGRLALFNALKTWRGDSSIWTYAKRSVVRDTIRFVSNEIGLQSHLLYEACRDDSDQRTPEEALDIAQRAALAAQQVSFLSENERRVVRMRFGEELDIRSIACRLGVSKSEADRIYHGAIEKLRERVGAQL